MKEFGYGNPLANYADIRDAVSAKAERDLEAIQERDIGFTILNGPPVGMTATQRLCAFLDWRYGPYPAKEVAQKHRISKATMVRCFGDRAVYARNDGIRPVNSNDLRRIFGLWSSAA